MGRTKWGREKKIIFVPDPGGMLHLPPAVFLFWSPIFGADPGLRIWCRGACLSWGLSAGGAVPVQRVFRFWNEGGCQAWDFGCRICGPAGRASFGACSGAGPEFILRNAAVTEQLVAEIATRLCGPHSRERLFRCKRLINKFNSTGTFRRHFGQVSKVVFVLEFLWD